MCACSFLLESVSGDARLLPDLLGRHHRCGHIRSDGALGVFQRHFRRNRAGYPDVVYARLGDGTRIFVDHSVRSDIQRVPKKDESVVFLTRNCFPEQLTGGTDTFF